jgi:hypothetical protein
MKEVMGQQLSELEVKREQVKRKIIDVLSETGIKLLKCRNISGVEIQAGHDVHAFFRSTSNPNKVIHVQAYPGFSNQKDLCIAAREMDYKKLMQIRQAQEKGSGPSIGNEDEAVTKMDAIPQTHIPNSLNSLWKLLIAEILPSHARKHQSTKQTHL